MFHSKDNSKNCVKFGENRLKGRGVTGEGQFWEILEKVITQKREANQIDSTGFCGKWHHKHCVKIWWQSDQRKGVKEGGEFVENLRKSNYAKTEGPIEMIFRCFTAKVIANIVYKFGDNRLKGRGVTGGQFGEILEKLWLRKNGEANQVDSTGFCGKWHHKHCVKIWWQSG